MTEEKITRVESALKYAGLGFCVIPVRPRSKEAAIRWQDYHQLRKPKPTIDEIESWLIGSENNFAVIHGKVSESIEIDIDGDGGKKHLEQVFPKFNSNLQSAIKNTMRVVTSNGQKIIFKYRSEEWPEGITTIKDLWKGEGKHNGIELRGNGCYSLGVGSIHPDGADYSLARGSDFNPLTLTKSEIEELVDLIAGEEYGDSFAAGRLKNNYSGSAGSNFNDEIISLGQVSDEIINTLAANAKKYYNDGSKNDFTLGLCGTLRKMGVSYDDVYKLEYLIDPADSKNLNRLKYIFNHNGPLAGKSYLTKVLAAQGLNQFQIPKALDELLGPVEELRKKKGKEQCKERERPIVEVVTVSEAQGKHFGRICVSGRIVSSSDLYQLVKKAVWKCFVCGAKMERKVVKITEPPLKPKQCPYCDNNPNTDFEDLHDYVNAITIIIQDDVPEAPLDGMSVIVFEEYTGEIHVGENVKIIGSVSKVQDKRSKRYHSVLLAEEIEYEHRRKLVLTDNDIEGIKRFAGKIPLYRSRLYLQNPADRLVKMFAPNVVGYEDKKLAILLSMVGAPEKNNIRGRINQLMIGPTGLAKTKLSREVVKVRPKSRYVSARNSTGLSLTAMISKEQDNYVLSLGPVPLAKNEVCVVNEFDKMHPEQQTNLLDVMEEGEIVVNKFAKLHKIESPTTIIATANPRNNTWKNPGKIGLDEIPFESIILNRFDLVLVFQDITDEASIRDFADSKTSYDQKHIEHNYYFLERYLEYARTISPQVSEEARSLLNDYWVSLKKNSGYLVTNRTLESIHRIAKAFARLYLSDIVDAEIATEAIKFMNQLFNDFHGSIHYIPEPTLLAYNETIKVIQQQKTPIDLIDAVKMACERDEQVSYYIGSIFKQNQNKKLRELCIKVLENPNIQKVQSNPIVVRFKDEHDTSDSMQSDLSDPRDRHFETQQTENEHHTGSTEEEERNVENNRGSHLADSHATEERRTANVSKKSAIETSVVENSRSQGSQGSRAISRSKVYPPIQASPLVHLCDPMIRQIPNYVHGPSHSIATSTYQPKLRIRYTDDGRHDRVFWKIYAELESASDKRTVRGQELKARLVSSNKFFVGDAVLITERMVSTEQLCLIGYDTYQRKNN